MEIEFPLNGDSITGIKIPVKRSSMRRAIESGDKKYIALYVIYKKLELGQIDKDQAIRMVGDIGINRSVVDLWFQNLKIKQFELEG